jgi:hypothetical protein
VIKLGTRKALLECGTTLVVNCDLYGWDDSGNKIDYLTNGDLVMLTGSREGGRTEVINVTKARKIWVWRAWLVKNTTLGFDARVLSQPVDD